MYKKNRFIKLSEAAKRLGVSRSCLIKWGAKGLIQIKWRKKGVAVVTDGAIQKCLVARGHKIYAKNIIWHENQILKKQEVVSQLSTELIKLSLSSWRTYSRELLARYPADTMIFQRRAPRAIKIYEDQIKHHENEIIKLRDAIKSKRLIDVIRL